MLHQLKRILRGLRKLSRLSKEKLGLITVPKRYGHLFHIIDTCRARRIMEIGTWNGNHAATMIQSAKKHWSPGEIEYNGFDLYEDLDEETFNKEVSKRPPSMKKVKEKLKRTGAKIALYKGNTLETLPKMVKKLPKMDFIFIDGGHSIETVNSDWKYSKKLMHENTVVIFDDYWNRDDGGCKRIVDSLDRKDFSVEILPPTDEIKKEWGVLRINFVKVTKKLNTGEENENIDLHA